MADNNNQNNDQNQNNKNQNDQGQQNQNNQQQNQNNQMQYTQAELDLLLAQKRVAAKNEFLKSIGFDGDEEGLKKTLERVMQEDEKNQTELEKVTKDLEKVQRTLAQEQAARKSAESKLEALKLGAKPETVDDLVILASAKLPENGELSTVISELKKTYPVYFVSDDDQQEEQDTGTRGRIGGKDLDNNNTKGKGKNDDKGGKKGGKGGDDGDKSLAERLLAGRTNSGKSNYFKNK